MPCPDGDFQVTPRRPSFYSSSLAQISQNRVLVTIEPAHQRRSGCPKHDFLYCIHVNCRRMGKMYRNNKKKEKKKKLSCIPQCPFLGIFVQKIFFIQKAVNLSSKSLLALTKQVSICFEDLMNIS